MLKTHEAVETHEVTVVDDVICNKCGGSLRCFPPKDGDFHEFVKIETSWGFNSKKDLLAQKVDICEPCWDEFCSTLAIPPSTFDFGTGNFSEPESEPELQLSLFTLEEMSSASQE